MKKILLGILATMLIAPIAVPVHAQTIDTSNMTQDQIKAELISLMQQVIILLQKMEELTTTPAATSTTEVVTPSSITPSSTVPAIVVPPANPTPTSTQAPAVAGASQPQPAGYSIQIVAWPGPVNNPGRTFIASSTLKSASDDTTNDSHVNLGAILINPDGQAVSDAVMTVIAEQDSTQNTQINGTGNVYGNPAVAYYPYSYAFKEIGSHTITFTAMGATASITLQAN